MQTGSIQFIKGLIMDWPVDDHLLKLIQDIELKYENTHKAELAILSDLENAKSHSKDQGM